MTAKTVRLPKQPRREEPETVPEPEAPQGSQEFWAKKLAELNKHRLRYVPESKWGWTHFDGKVWSFKNPLIAGALIREFLRAEAASLNDPSEAKRLCTWKYVNDVEQLAKRDRQHLHATTKQWDKDPWLLNTPKGVVNLCIDKPRAGELQEHQASNYMTKITAKGPAAKAHCPLWLDFLEKITNGDRDLQSYLQRMAGYTLTGITDEQMLAFLYGTGGNGKSVWTDTLSDILGDYAWAASMDAFTYSRHERHSTELASMRGARMVIATETKQGSRWDERKIKQLTGGGQIAARFMHQDEFQFTPQFKLWIVGNHKPEIRTVDDAMRRRVQLIPFTVKISEEERDRELAKKLKKEWPGILRWMIEGCLEWQKHSLAPPPAVLKATTEYLAEEDRVERFIKECCVDASKDEEIGSTELFQAWEKWCELHKEYVLPHKAFSQAIVDHGYTKKRARSGRGNVFRGIVLSE